MFELGVGTKPIPQKQLTTEKLAAAIMHATADDSLRASAQRLGAAIRQEDGVTNAIAYLEQVWRTNRVLPR